MKNKIKFVYFDVGGVVFRWKEIFTEIALKYNKKSDEVLFSFYKYDKLSCLGKISPDDIWKGMRKDLGIMADKDLDFLEFSTSKFIPITQTHQFIKELTESIPVGLLTNIHPGVFEKSVSKKHIPDINYHAVVKSYEIGMVKPDKNIFLHAQKLAKVPHKNILFIDDLEANLLTARSFGWKTILFETDNPEKSITDIKKLLGLYHS